MNKKIAMFLLGLSLTSVNMARADDTEIFYTGTTIKPNVLLVVDTSGSMGDEKGTGTRMTEVQTAIRAIIDDPDNQANLNLGLARFSNNSGTIAVPIIPLDEIYSATNTLGAAALKAVLNDFPTTGGTPVVPALYESLLYFRGDPINTAKTISSSASYDLPVSSSYTGGHVTNHNKTISNSGNEVATYISPLTQTCERNNSHIVMLTDGYANRNSFASNIKTTIDLTSCPANSNDDKECGEELAYYMANNDQSTTLAEIQKVKVHTVGFDFNDEWLKEVATAGGGEYKTATSASELTTQFKAIFGAILEQNSTFTSAGVSINNFNRLNHRDEIYFSLFKPNLKVQWSGNLKKYKISSAGNIIDKLGNAALDATTGYFSTTSLDYWSALTAQPDPANGHEVTSDGAANKLTGDARKVFSNLGGANLSELKNEATSLALVTLADFNASTLTGITDADQLERLVLFTRSQNADGSDNSTNRMSDPLHSKPYVATYSETNTGGNLEYSTVIYYGDNQGLLHAINAVDGTENWAFIPKDLLANQNNLYNNPIHDANHVYGLDGSPTAWITATNKSLYIGMRRGGRSYYAMDITSKTAPALKWKKTNTTTGVFSELGQTWSTPVKTKMKISIGGAVSAKDVLIFAGGYDEDQDSTLNRAEDSMGRAIYIIDADTGATLWVGGHAALAGANAQYSDMKYSIPSDIKVIDTDGNGLADQMFVGDMGGQIWRFYMSESTGVITGKVIARFGGNGSEAANQRFYHAPDISLTTNGQLALGIGSGYQAHPLNKVNEDSFYLLNLPLTETTSSVITKADLLDVTGSATVDSNDLEAKDGWYIDLSGTGEKVLASSLTANSEVWFTTFQPSPQTVNCVVTPGTSYLYRINVVDGTPLYDRVLPDDTGGTATNSCSDVTCTTENRRVQLRTGTLPPEPVLIRLNGKKLIGVGSEITEIGSSKADTMYWSQK